MENKLITRDQLVKDAREFCDKVAIEEGATIVRIGSLLFGKRN